MDQREAMREKMLALMNCSPDEFETGSLQFDPYQDHYIVREGERIHPPATKPATDDRRNNYESPCFFKRIRDWIERNVEM